VFSATSNNDSATVSANSEAQPGTYSFFVEQLAQAQQSTFDMSDDTYSATGTFELTMGDSTMDIDLASADANNSLVDTIDSLTTYGDDDTSAGVFAGDAGLKSLTSQMDDIVHSYYDGSSIVDYGITLDSDGHLQIDADTFDDAMEENPDGLTSIFVGDDSMVAQLDNLMDSYLDSSNGIIAQRQQGLDDDQTRIDDRSDQLTETYNTNYDRYVTEYTNTIIEVYTMKMSMAAFS
jgi:flagellar hook-associated protein 2